jgi:hypothetical protein
MKLRLRGNSLRLRVNRGELERLASGALLEEQVHFPGQARMSYTLEPSDTGAPAASFHQGVIRISAPRKQLNDWANNESIGIYFDLPANDGHLTIAIEKDLECLDAPAHERDPEAFPRSANKNC